MAFLDSPAARLNAALVAAGFDYVIGVSFSADGTAVLSDASGVLPPTDPAYAFARSFDIRPHRLRTLAEVYADFSTLTAEQQQAVVFVAAAQFAKSDPGATKTLAGVDIPVSVLDI